MRWVSGQAPTAVPAKLEARYTREDQIIYIMFNISSHPTSEQEVIRGDRIQLEPLQQDLTIAGDHQNAPEDVIALVALHVIAPGPA